MANSFKFHVWCFLITIFTQEILTKKVFNRSNNKITQLNITKIFLNYDRKTFLISKKIKLDANGNSLVFVDAHLLHDIPSDKLYVICLLLTNINKLIHFF